MSDVKWIKIRTDLFEDEKIRLIQSMPKGDTLIVVWIKLLCLAGKLNQEGFFYLFNDVPYDLKTLSTVLQRRENVVKNAIEVFQKLGLVEVCDGVISITNWNKHQSLQAFEKKKEYMREYMKEYRSKKCKANSKANVSRIEEDKEEDKELDIKKKDKRKTVYYPTDELLDKTFSDYVAMRKQLKKPMSDRAVDLAMKKLNDLSGGDNDTAIKIIEQSIMNSWQGLFPLKTDKSTSIDWSKV